MEEVVIEMLHLPDLSRSHAKVTAFPATIGRGYDNQVVLYDPEVSTVHARLERAVDGALVLSDAGSTNGVLVGDDERRVSSVEISHGMTVRLGNTELTFKQATRAGEKTLVSRRVTRADPLASKRLFGGSLLLLSGVIVLTDYRSAVAEQDLGDLIGGLFVMLVLCFIYASVWSVLGRLVTHTWRYLAHVSLALLWLIGGTVGGGLVPSFAVYAFDAPRASAWVTIPLMAVVAGSILQAHLQRAVNWSPRRARLTSAMLVVTVVVVFVGRGLLSREPFNSSLPINGSALPPRYLLVSPQPVDALLQRVDSLQRSVDALAQEE